MQDQYVFGKEIVSNTAWYVLLPVEMEPFDARRYQGRAVAYSSLPELAQSFVENQGASDCSIAVLPATRRVGGGHGITPKTPTVEELSVLLSEIDRRKK